MSNLQPVCLITGASAGIGAALAREFAASGHVLALAARREEPMVALSEEIASKGGTRAHVFAVDLEARNGPDRLADALVTRALEPAIVINNAGYGLMGDAATLGAAAQLAMIDLNIRTLTDLSLRWVDSLARHRGGILNVASLAGFLPGPGLAVYHATKAYVLSFSEALHVELKPRGVRVTALCPGPVRTEFYSRAGISDEHFSGHIVRPADRVAREGYRGFMRGRRVVIPGTLNKLIAALPRLLPRRLALTLGNSQRR